MGRVVITSGFGWGAIARLGLVQAALGAIVVLATSTLNRVMVVELALPALLPGALVAWHYAVQVVRPRMGHGADVGGRCTPWMFGGICVLALGSLTASAAVGWMAAQPAAGIALALVGFALIGFGVSATGTTLLVMLAKHVAGDRRAGAATMVWLMMIASFAITASVAGAFLDPYTPARLLAVTGCVCAGAVAVTALALAGLEARAPAVAGAAAADRSQPFRERFLQVWGEPQARRFTIFVFVSMLAYSAQDLILEPFAGTVMGYTPGESTRLSGVQHGGALTGMLLAAFAGRRFAGAALGSLRGWTIGGCLLSALALLGLAAGGVQGAGWPLKPTVFALGAFNGAFAIAAIASMMAQAGQGRADREGVRMGLWGAAQALAFALGGLAGTAAADLARALIASPGHAYALVFALEGALFVVSARLAAGAVVAPAPALPSGAGAARPIASPEPSR